MKTQVVRVPYRPKDDLTDADLLKAAGVEDGRVIRRGDKSLSPEYRLATIMEEVYEEDESRKGTYEVEVTRHSTYWITVEAADEEEAEEIAIEECSYDPASADVEDWDAYVTKRSKDET